MDSIRNKSEHQIAWIGHRGSDALLFSKYKVSDVFSLFGKPPFKCKSVQIDQALGVRKQYTSDNQSEIYPYLPEQLSDPVVIPFRPDNRLISWTKSHNLEVILPNVELTQMLEKKEFANIAPTEIKMLFPKTAYHQIGSVSSFDSMRHKHGIPFILKSNLSVSGNNCYYIRSVQDWNNALQDDLVYPITSWNIVRGVSVNYHLLVDSCTFFVLPSTKQIFDNYDSFRPFQFSGSSINHNPPNKNCGRLTSCFAKYLQSIGYYGVCGLDVVCNDFGAYIVDINPRFQGSSLLVSLNLWDAMGLGIGDCYFLAFENKLKEISERIEKASYTAFRFQEQRFIKHKGDAPLIVNHKLLEGWYRVENQSLKFCCPFSFDDRFPHADILIFDSPEVGTICQHNSCIARVIFTDKSKVSLCQQEEFARLIENTICTDTKQNHILTN
jgi:hypothetical protein